jgi:hypothetical protein
MFTHQVSTKRAITLTVFNLKNLSPVQGKTRSRLRNNRDLPKINEVQTNFVQILFYTIEELQRRAFWRS